MKTTFNYKGLEVIITKQESASSAVALKNGEPFCAAFINCDKITIEEKIKSKIDSKLK